jgi:hypothetical protein
MTREEAYLSATSLSEAIRRQLRREHQGYAFQMPPHDDTWWQKDVNSSATPNFGRSVAEAYLKAVAKLREEEEERR